MKVLYGPIDFNVSIYDRIVRGAVVRTAEASLRVGAIEGYPMTCSMDCLRTNWMLEANINLLQFKILLDILAALKLSIIRILLKMLSIQGKRDHTALSLNELLNAV